MPHSLFLSMSTNLISGEFLNCILIRLPAQLSALSDQKVELRQFYNLWLHLLQYINSFRLLTEVKGLYQEKNRGSEGIVLENEILDSDIYGE